MVNVSRNVFTAGATLSIVLTNTCAGASPSSVRRNAVYHVNVENNSFALVNGNSGGTFGTGAIALSGLIPFGHWVSIARNRIVLLTTKIFSDVSTVGSFDRTVIGISLAALAMAAPQSSLATSAGGADWSFCQTLVEQNWMVLNLTLVNVTQNIPLWRNTTSFVVVGIVAPTASVSESLSRLQILSNDIFMNITTQTTPQALLAWNSVEMSSLAPPGRISDAAVGILWHCTIASNMTMRSSSIIEFNANTIHIAAKWAAAYGLWQGTTESLLLTTPVTSLLPAGQAPFIVLRSDAKLHIYSNLLATPKPDLARFVFAIVVTSSMDVATTSSTGSGTFRVEFNHLYNVDASKFTSGVGIMIACPQLLVGFNSLVAFRNNRMWGFPITEGNTSIPSSINGGVFAGISFVPYLLRNGSVVPFSAGATLPVHIVGSVSFFVIDANIVYIVSRALQPTIMFRGISIVGASSACRITQNYLYSLSAEEDPALSQRNVSVQYGAIHLIGAKSVWVFVRQAVAKEDFLGGVLGLYDLGLISPKGVTVCGSCEFKLGCTARGTTSADSNFNPGTQRQYTTLDSSYAPQLMAAAGGLQIPCDDSCGTAVLACFAPGTREATGYLRNDYLPVCSCRCALGYSYSRQCGPPQGLNSGTVSISNNTFEMTITQTQSVSGDRSGSRSVSGPTATSSMSVTTTTTISQTRKTLTTSHTDTVTFTESMSQCYNYTSWETLITWPFIQQTPNYFFGNISYKEMHNGALPMNISLLPPARVNQHWFNFNRPNWNSPLFNITYEPSGFSTPDAAMQMTGVEKIIGLASTQFSIGSVSSSKYEEIRLRWLFEVTNAVCPLRPYIFFVELKIDPVLVLVANDTRDATAAAMFVAALYGNAPAGALLARAPLMVGIVACYGPMHEYEDSTSMTFFRFGSFRGQYARGGVVGNLIAVAVIVVFYLLALLFLSIITHVSSMSLAIRNGMEALHIKSNYVGVALCVLQPTLAAGIALLRNPVDEGDDIIGGVAIGVCALYVMFISYKLLLDPPDVVLVYDLIRPHQVPKSKVVKFVRYFFWPKYHFLPRNDYRRKIERMLLTETDMGKQQAPPSDSEGGVPMPPAANNNDGSAPGADKQQRSEEYEEDNAKLMGLLKMSADEYAKSRRWERMHCGDVLIIPPPPVKEGVVLEEQDDFDDPLDAPQEEKPMLILDEDVEKPEFTDISRQVQSDLSYEDMFNNYGGGTADSEERGLGIGIITENERLNTTVKKGRGPLNLVELQRIEREEEIRKAKEAAKEAREKKIAEIKEKIAAEVAAREAAAKEAQEKEEERVMVPLQVLDLMLKAKSDKHDWHDLIRGWSHPRYALGPHIFAIILGVAHGFGDDFCRQGTFLLLAIYLIELIVLIATRLRAVVLPFHRVWYIVTLSIGVISSVCMLVGQEAEVNDALDVSAGFAFLFAMSCLVRVVVDGVSTIFHMRVNSEKAMSLIARGQEILDDEEVELHYVPPPLPEKPQPVVEEAPSEPIPPPKPPTPPLVEDQESEEEEWEDDPNRIFNPLGEALPAVTEEAYTEEYDFQ